MYISSKLKIQYLVFTRRRERQDEIPVIRLTDSCRLGPRRPKTDFSELNV